LICTTIISGPPTHQNRPRLLSACGAPKSNFFHQRLREPKETKFVAATTGATVIGLTYLDMATPADGRYSRAPWSYTSQNPAQSRLTAGPVVAVTVPMHQGKIPNTTANEVHALKQIQVLVGMALDADDATRDKRMRDVQWTVDTLLSGVKSPFVGL
jgi:hypothetical protein